jgi:hypothetical protein
VIRRRLVYLGPAPGAAPAGELLHEGGPLVAGARLELVRKRSRWNAHRGVERIIAGSHAGRADLLLEGAGVHPEHVRLYLPLQTEGPNDLLSTQPGSVRVNGRDVAPRDWCALRPGDEVELGPWLFRFEQDAADPQSPDRGAPQAET